jgi:hypothetical protein
VITLDSAHPPIGIWYIKLEEKTDFMGCLVSDQQHPLPDTNQAYHFDFRFRYYRDDKVFDSEDRKNWYHVTDSTSATVDEAIHKVRSVVLRLCEMKSWDTPEEKPQMTEMLYRDYASFGKFFEAFYKQPFIYSKMASPEDIKKYEENEDDSPRLETPSKS